MAPVQLADHPAAIAAQTPGVERRGRVEWLDGVRGCAAVYVMLHHIWLAAYPHFPVNSGPWYLGWLLYGHLGVAVFIVVSGFSLTLQPTRHGMRLPGGARGFGRRRAWRILPAYWAALAYSGIVVILLTSRLNGIHVNAKSF